MRNYEESAIQKAVCQHLDMRGVKGLVYFAVPNQGIAGGRVRGAILKSMGLKAGVSDLLFYHAGKSYALEIKSSKGITSPAQHDFLRRATAAGVTCAVAKGLDEALNILTRWGLLR
jgi:hypothetical protein